MDHLRRLLWLCLFLVPVPALGEEETFASRFAPLFAAAFDDPDAARAVWQDQAGAVLERAEEQYLPAIEFSLFADKAIARMSTVREAYPDVSAKTLSFAALDGFMTEALWFETHVNSVLTEDRTFIYFDPTTPPEPPADPNRPAASFGDREVAGVPVAVLPSLEMNLRIDGRRFDSRVEATSGPLVLDLRGNRGGVLTAIEANARPFGLSKGPMFSVDGQDTTKVWETTGNTTRRDMPTLVLIDERTDSGGLMLARVLSSEPHIAIGGKVVGEPDDTVATILPVRCPPTVTPACDRIYLRLPTHRLVMPDGQRMGEGFTPDLAFDPVDPAAVEKAVADWLSRL